MNTIIKIKVEGVELADFDESYLLGWINDNKLDGRQVSVEVEHVED